jgi:hypothetical protein
MPRTTVRGQPVRRSVNKGWGCGHKVGLDGVTGVLEAMGSYDTTGVVVISDF